MTIRIENWSVTAKGSVYTPPERLSRHLQGTVFGHPSLPDGDSITSSTIMSSKGQNVETKSGSKYVLGKPDPKWLAWMEEKGIEFDPENPIQIIR